MAMHVRVVPYDSCWPELFRREAEAVGRILGSNRKEIHHIGSTAVTGLAAKPVIDMMPVVWELEAVEACYAQFEAIGYEGMGELGIPGRRYFRKGGDDRTHQIHIFCADSQKDIDRHLAGARLPARKRLAGGSLWSAQATAGAAVSGESGRGLRRQRCICKATGAAGAGLG